MSERATVTVDAMFYENALFDAWKKALEGNSAKQFDETFDLLVEYMQQHPESKADDMPETEAELRIHMLTQLVHGAFGLK